MNYKKHSSCLILIAIVLSTFTIFSCSKEEEPPADLRGDYCTYRNGITGHTSSTTNIAQDMSDRNDLIISNISGYANTSEAFKDIACDRAGNRLTIPEKTVLIGNSDMMIITGEGEIGVDGSIKLDIQANTPTLENNYSLYLTNNSSFNYYKAYTGDGQSLTVQANQIQLKVTTEDQQELEFIINETENADCSLTFSRQSIIEEGSQEGYLVEAEIFFSGSEVFGTLYYSSGSWQNAQSIELNLD